jgi:secretion/DNA translocation related TadE-like protein
VTPRSQPRLRQRVQRREPSRAVCRAGRASQRGSATLFAVAVTGLLVLVGGALAVVGAMVEAHRVAQSAADLAALAGAHAANDPGAGGDPCDQAAAIAGANGATLDTCAVEGRDVRVHVTVAGPHWLGQTHDLTAEARAGPAP